MKFAICCMQIVYTLIKVFPEREKVVMISRQSNTITLDFRLLKKTIQKNAPDVDIVVLTKKLEGNLIMKMTYALHMIMQMYHMATAKVVVLDGYCIAASVLDHRPGLRIVQIWHALSAVKCFGYQSLDKAEGSSSVVARTMKMHQNYDYVFCASRKTAAFFSEAFCVPMEKFEILGMPRVDYISDKHDRNDEILSEYPEFGGKETILYIPTFRTGEDLAWHDFVQEVDFNKYNLIISAHPLDSANIDQEYLVDKKYSTYDLMKFADYIITDYSAVSIEASILDKPILFYVYDYDKYKVTRGLNIDLFTELPSETRTDLREIMKIINNKSYSGEELRKFKTNYVETLGFSNTESISQRIIEMIRE